MERDKMNRIKNKMEQRTIQPSSDSWNRLEQMLDNADEPVKQIPYIKYVIAASVILILGVSVLIQLNSNSENNEVIPVLVEEDNKVLKANEREIDKVLEKTKPKEQSSVIAQVEPKVAVKKKREVKIEEIEKPKSSLVLEEKEKEEKIAQIKEELKTILLASIQDSLLKEKQQPKNIDDEVDGLLAQAMKDIEHKEQYAYNRITDAETLLADIEEELDLFSDEEYLLAEAQGEIDESIKEKVYQILKNNYKRVKASVANRNY